MSFQQGGNVPLVKDRVKICRSGASKCSIILFRNTDGIPSGPRAVEDFNLVEASRMDSLLMFTFDIARLDTGTLQAATETCAGDNCSVEKTLANFDANIAHIRCLLLVTSSFHFMEEGSPCSFLCFLTKFQNDFGWDLSFCWIRY